MAFVGWKKLQCAVELARDQGVDLDYECARPSATSKKRAGV
jgi:hypothetical protein